MTRVMACGLAVAVLVALMALGSAAGPVDDEIPAPFARLEGLVGSWKGTARPSANKVRGWPESHAWAWKFAGGAPVGMILAVEGGKVVARGELGYDPATGRFTLAATDPAGKPATYVGPAPAGKDLVLDRAGPAADGGKERLTIRPNSNGIRYTMLVDRQAPGAPQYKNAIEVGLTREGEAFAAGGPAGVEGPKCIITGGAASLTVSYNGTSYPLCCTGCRDEFNDNPDKYIARAAQKAAAEGDRPAPPGRASGEFDGLLDAPRSAAMPAAKGKGEATPAAGEPATRAKDGPADRATREYRLGQALEKAGKTRRALDTYRGIVRKYPGTPAATDAAGRIKALDAP